MYCIHTFTELGSQYCHPDVLHTHIHWTRFTKYCHPMLFAYALLCLKSHNLIYANWKWQLQFLDETSERCFTPQSVIIFKTVPFPIFPLWTIHESIHNTRLKRLCISRKKSYFPQKCEDKYSNDPFTQGLQLLNNDHLIVFQIKQHLSKFWDS